MSAFCGQAVCASPALVRAVVAAMAGPCQRRDFERSRQIAIAAGGCVCACVCVARAGDEGSISSRALDTHGSAGGSSAGDQVGRVNSAFWRRVRGAREAFWAPQNARSFSRKNSLGRSRRPRAASAPFCKRNAAITVLTKLCAIGALRVARAHTPRRCETRDPQKTRSHGAPRASPTTRGLPARALARSLLY